MPTSDIETLCLSIVLYGADSISIRLALDTVADFAVRMESVGIPEGSARSNSLGERAVHLAAVQNGLVQ